MADASARIPSRIRDERSAAGGAPRRTGTIALLVAAASATGILCCTDMVSRAAAQTINRTIGFADVVEKVKPAVFSVRVKIDAGKRTKETSPFLQSSEPNQTLQPTGHAIHGSSSHDGKPA